MLKKLNFEYDNVEHAELIYQIVDNALDLIHAHLEESGAINDEDVGYKGFCLVEDVCSILFFYVLFNASPEDIITDNFNGFIKRLQIEYTKLYQDYENIPEVH